MLNRAVIWLLTKAEEAETLIQLHPIALCNVLVKIVSKVLANLLQAVMHKLIGKFQSSCIPGKLTTDIIITQEAIHTL